MTGTWIAFEGGEGSGKSTQARRLAETLDAVLTREPGGTPVGERVRAVLLDPSADIDPRAETLLMAADRAQHVSSVVVPALERGEVIVSDRSAYSSIAYQGHGRGLPFDEVRSISAWASGGRWPDLVFLLDVPDDVRSARMQRDHDRLEAAGAAFHQRVNAGFREMAAADPDGWIVVDGTPPPDEIAAHILETYRRWSRG
ncbi:MAG TPA: dTMP kinase [Acidimicrobiales bacterium]|nr:dTMP kinase [Acidimicrobiales bacterium]